MCMHVSISIAKKLAKFRCWTAPYLIRWYAGFHAIFRTLIFNYLRAGDYSPPREEERRTVWRYTGLSYASY